MPAENSRTSLVTRSLLGDLPCVRCGYSLRGLSITGTCPECGTPIQTTILHSVDPHAPQLRPLPHPWMVGTSLFLASVFGLLAAVFLVTPWAADVIHEILRVFLGHEDGWLTYQMRGWLPLFAVVSLLITMMFCLMLYRPVIPTPVIDRMGVLVSVLGFLLMYYATMHIVWIDVGTGFHRSWQPITALHRDAEMLRALYRMVFNTGLVIVLVSIRPVARLLVYRSLALRPGRVGRQTLYPMAVAAAIAMLGDLTRYFAIRFTSELDVGPSVLYAPGEVIVWVCSAFIIWGLVRSTIDSWRIRASLLAPSPSLHDLLAPGSS